MVDEQCGRVYEKGVQDVCNTGIAWVNSMDVMFECVIEDLQG